MTRGRFIVIEGLDGVGKSTVIQNLASHLAARLDDTPGPDLRPLRTSIMDALSHQTSRALFYAATVIERGTLASSLAEEGITTVMDRYWLSTISYARARGVDIDLEAVAAQVPAPDLTLWLTLDETERRRRLGPRGMTSEDRETLDPAFADRVMAAAHANPVPLGRVHFVDLTGADQNQALVRVLKVIEARLEVMP